MAVRVKKFNPRNMKESRITFLLGKRATGKSVLLKDLLSQMPKPDYVLAMAPTEETLKMFRSILPESCIFDHFSQEKLDRAVSLQKELVARGKKRTLLILLDDCMYQRGVLKSPSMRFIFLNGRHAHIGLIIACQYMMDVDVSLRSNVDYVLTLRENVLTNRNKLHKYFFGQYGKFDEFDRVFTTCTQNYGCLVLDGTVSSTNATDCVMWYRASLNVEDFQLCKRIYWKLSQQCEKTVEEIRHAQSKQFEIENASAGAMQKMQEQSKIVVVQTEDEFGQVVSSSTDV